MTSPNEERISGLVDGELQSHERSEAIDELLSNPSARQCWERYNLIGDTLKRSLPSALNPDFASGVMAALKDEPTVLAPPKRTPSPFARRVAGFAVAASVAVVGVLGVQNLYQEEVIGQPALAPVAQSGSPSMPLQTPLPSQASSQVLQSPANAPVAGSGVRSGIQLVQGGVQQNLSQGMLLQEAAAQRARQFPPNLNRYLVDHSQQTARSVQGVIPYARIVTFPASSIAYGPDTNRAQK